MGIGSKKFGNKLVELLPRLMREISRHENNYVTTGKITCQQFLVLEELSHKKQWKMNEFVQSINSSFSSMTEMVGRLVRHGLAKRSRGKKDRRTVFVEITDKGRQILTEVYQQKKEGIVRVFKRLSAREREDYLRIIEKLVQRLSSVKGDAS